MYKDAKDAESQWLFLMNQVSSRLGIARTECKKPVQNFWTYKLKELMVGKSSLRFVYNKDLKAGSIHKLWTSL
jgi:hypothetical protein